MTIEKRINEDDLIKAKMKADFLRKYEEAKDKGFKGDLEEFIRKIHRPEGVSHRNFNRVGSQYTISFEYNCACGKSSGHKQTKRALNLWFKLHMKKCEKVN